MTKKKTSKKKTVSKNKKIDTPIITGPCKFSELPLEDQKLIGPPEIKLEPNSELRYQSDKIFSTENYDACVKLGGAMLDAEAIEIAKGGRKNIKEKVPFDIDKFADMVENDKVPFDQMMSYVTSLFVGSTDNKSFDDVVSKFFNFHLGKMDLKDLVNLKYKVEQLINEKAMGKQENMDVSYKIG
jgi:hypothetical protein